MPPPVFSRISKKNGGERRQIWGTCAQIKNTPCVQILTSRSKGQATRSGQSQMCTPGPASVGTVLVRMFSNFQDDVLE